MPRHFRANLLLFSVNFPNRLQIGATSRSDERFASFPQNSRQQYIELTRTFLRSRQISP
jgi:hypothetical protein